MSVKGYGTWDDIVRNTDPRFVGAVDAFARSLAMAKDNLDADVVHCHTWYTDMGGVLAGKLWGVPYVLTIHSLEPLRPWKVEQLGNAYHLSAWMERTAIEQADAVIAVSQRNPRGCAAPFNVAAREESTSSTMASTWTSTRRRPQTDALVRYGVDPARPYVLFVGRITRQKGIIHLVNAIPTSTRRCKWCSARAPQTRPEIGREMTERIAGGQRRPPRCDLDPGDAGPARRDPTLFARRRLLLPLGLRAVRHHQPRSDGLRDRRGGLGGGRHQRGSRARRDGPAGRPAPDSRAPSTR